MCHKTKPNGKKVKKIDKYFGLARELKRLGKKTGGIRNQRKNQNHSNHSIKIS